MKNYKRMRELAQESVDKQIEQFIDPDEEATLTTFHAIEHLKENLDWYSLKYDHLKNQNRHSNIVNDVLLHFQGANKKAISKFLNRNLFFSVGFMLTASICLINFIGIALVFLIVDTVADKIWGAVGVTIGGTLITSALVGIWSDTRLRFHRVKKVKNERKL